MHLLFVCPLVAGCADLRGFAFITSRVHTHAPCNRPATMYGMGAIGMVELAGIVQPTGTGGAAGGAAASGAGAGAEALRDRQLALIATLEASLAKVDAEISKLGGTPGAGGAPAGKAVSCVTLVQLPTPADTRASSHAIPHVHTESERDSAMATHTEQKNRSARGFARSA